MRIKPEVNQVALVLVGPFAPQTFLPAWFSRHGLLTDQQADSSVIEIATNDIVKFRADWLQLYCDKERFVLSGSEPPYVRLSDLACRIFVDLLVGTPIKAVGVNRLVHFAVKNNDARVAIGNALAPPNAWGEWGDKLKLADEKRQSGMLSITMQQSIRDDEYKGVVKARVEPSMVIPMGVFVEVNDHYQFDEDELDGVSLAKILSGNFDKSVARCEWIIDQVMALA